MQTSPPRGFTRHVISTPRSPYPGGRRVRGRFRAVVFTSRHLRRRRCQPHTRVQYKIYTWFTQWSISDTLAFCDPAHNGRGRICHSLIYQHTTRVTILHSCLGLSGYMYVFCDEGGAQEMRPNPVDVWWLIVRANEWWHGQPWNCPMYGFNKGDWRQRRLLSTKISVIEPWIGEIQISREITSQNMETTSGERGPSCLVEV